MNIRSLTSFKQESYNVIGIITDLNNINSLKNEFPELTNFISADLIKFDNESITTIPTVINGKKLSYNIIGLDANPSAQEIYNAFGLIGKNVSAAKVENILIHMSSIASSFSKDYMLDAIKGFVSGSYSFNKFLTTKKASMPESVDFITRSPELDSTIPHALMVANNIQLSRSLVDEPSNLMTPEALANKAVEVFKDSAIEVSIYKEDEIKKLGMNLYLAVAQGATNRPHLIVMRYNGNPASKEKIGLIGKGITYDTGGYSIKPTGGMITMKSDMGGGAAVIGAMSIIAEEKPKVNVVGVIAACENRISGNAYLPGDILTSMNGKTVEITNTDAEGRLTLADAMTYAIREENATKVTDICTLTGACVVALGEEYAGVVTWDDAIWNKVEIVSNETLEPCWRLPLNKTFQKKNHSKVADLKNSGERWGGSITAGAFVGEFAEDKPWVHFDVAGTAYIENEKPAMRAGGTGYGAHLLAEFVKTF